MSLLDELEKGLKSLDNEKKKGKAASAGLKEGVARKQVGMAMAAEGKEALVQKARRVAREMAVNGPVTIEDVCDHMAQDNDPVWAGSKDCPANWKGSVFNTDEFVCVGSVQSRKASNHGRKVRQWALKSWLDEHPMHGQSSDKSAFSLTRIFQEFSRRHHGADPTSLRWIIGRDGLSLDTLKMISEGDNSLFGIEVFMASGFGAILTYAVPSEKQDGRGITFM